MTAEDILNKHDDRVSVYHKKAVAAMEEYATQQTAQLQHTNEVLATGYHRINEENKKLQQQLNECLELLYRATTHLWSGNEPEGPLTMSDIYHHLHNEHPDFMTKYLKDDEIIHSFPLDNLPAEKTQT